MSASRLFAEFAFLLSGLLSLSVVNVHLDPALGARARAACLWEVLAYIDALLASQCR